MYAGGTFTGSANSGLDFAAIIRDAADGHANWTIEDTHTSATRTCFTLLCAGAGNSAGIDFRVHLIYVTATPTQVAISISEGWDAGANTMTKFGFFNSAAGLDVDNTLAGSTNIDNTTTLGKLSITPAASASQRYDICISADRLSIFHASSSASHYAYVGLYDIGPGLTSVTAPMPLACVAGNAALTPAVGGASGPAGGFMTRHPERVAGSTQNGRAMFQRMLRSADDMDVSQVAFAALAPHVWPQGGVLLGADAFDNRQEVGKPMIVTQSPSMGGLLGWPKGVVLSRTTDNLGYGDTITVGGVTYRYMGTGTNVDPDVSSDQPMVLWADVSD